MYFEHKRLLISLARKFCRDFMGISACHSWMWTTTNKDAQMRNWTLNHKWQKRHAWDSWLVLILIWAENRLRSRDFNKTPARGLILLAMYKVQNRRDASWRWDLVPVEFLVSSAPLVAGAYFIARGALRGRNNWVHVVVKRYVSCWIGRSMHAAARDRLRFGHTILCISLFALCCCVSLIFLPHPEWSSHPFLRSRVRD